MPSSHTAINLAAEERPAVQKRAIWWDKGDSSEGFVFRRRPPGAPPEAGGVHSLVVWSRHRAATRQHRPAGAELLRADGSSKWRQVLGCSQGPKTGLISD